MHTKHFCRFASIVLLAAVFVCSLSSCKTNGDESASPSSALSGDVSQTDAYRDENGNYVPDLPAKDWGEREFRVLVRSSKFGTYQSDDFTTDSQMYGDLINDQVYERNARIEERYNVKIVPVLSDALLADIRTEVVAGTGMFDAAMPTLREAAVLAGEGSLYDLRTLDSIDLDAPWWDENATKAFSIGNAVYFTTGDITILNKVCTTSMIFNKEIIRNNNMEDPYTLVREHKWTFDKFLEMAKAVSTESSDDKRVYGLVTGYADALTFIGSTGATICKKDENDYPYLSFGEERTQTVARKVLETFASSGAWAIYAQDCEDPIWVTSLAVFHEGRALFRPSGFSATTKLRAYDVDFGIIPMPMWDEEQENYYSYCGTGEVASLTIPISVQDPEFSAFIVEACAAEAKNTLTPAYYEVNLIGRDVRDDESEEMLDIIFGNIIYDAGEAYNFGQMNTVLATLVQNRSADITSAFEAVKPQINQEIQQIIDLYSK